MRLNCPTAGEETDDGSLHFTKGASCYFVPAFSATQTPDRLREKLAELRQILWLSETHEFEFHKMRSTEIRNEVSSVLAHADFQA